MAKKKKAKKKKTAKKRTCSKCKKEGHNARGCPEAELASPEPSDVFDLDDTVKASDMADAPPSVMAVDPSKPPPGLKLRIPKRKKARSKAELAFWATTEKKMAPGSLAEGGSLTLDIPRISSGVFGTDVGLYGGIPQGRFVLVTGMPKSGKTGWCLNTVSEYQANHCSECFQRKCDCKNRDVPDVLWIDVEHRIAQMLRWVQGHGVNLDCLRILGPPTGQNVVDLVDHVIREAPSSKIGLIVLDSLAHVTSMDEIKKATLDGPTIGRNAMLLNAAWRKWTSALHSLGIDNPRKPTVLCINQIRHKVGVNFGSPEVLPGGLGQGYASTVVLRFQAGAPNFLVWKEAKAAEKAKGKTGDWVVKQKAYKSSFKPGPDQTPDFVTVNYRITTSGHCPPGRSGSFNYWLKSAHGHRCGDPDNGLQLWQYCKRYDLVEVDGQTKRLFGHEASTFAALEAAFRADPKAQRKAWAKLMGMLRE